MSIIKYEEPATEVPAHAPERQPGRRSRRWWVVGAVVAALVVVVAAATGRPSGGQLGLGGVDAPVAARVQQRVQRARPARHIEHVPGRPRYALRHPLVGCADARMARMIKRPLRDAGVGPVKRSDVADPVAGQHC